MMPGALINTMNADELKDLFAYFVSGGNNEHPVYKSLNRTRSSISS